MESGIWSVLAAGVAVLAACAVARSLVRRRRAEAALREGEQRHAEILDALPLGIYIYRLQADGRLILAWANAAAGRILGLEHQDLIGKPIEEAFPPLAATDVPEKYREVAQTGRSWFTDRLEYHDGRCGGIFEVLAFRIRPDEVAVTFTDVTHRWRMHDALQQYYFLNDAIIQASPAGIAAIDRQRRIMLWNPACERIFGWSAGEVLGKPLERILDESQREISRRIQDLGFTGEGVKDILVRRRRRDGSPLLLNLTTAPLYDARGEVLGVVALMLDLTERQAAERALRASEARCRRFLETAQEGVWMTDAVGHVTFVNDELTSLLGYSREEALGRHVLEFVAPESRQQTAEAFEELKQGGKRRLELILRRKDGQPVYVTVSGCGELDEEGRFLGALGLVADASHRLRLEEQLSRFGEALDAGTGWPAAPVGGERGP
jgi:PAS domain S-box-containing protein